MNAPDASPNIDPVPPRWLLWRTWLLTFTIGLSLYAATANRGVQWQDSGFQQARIVAGQLEHPLGLALVHPLQYYLGRAAIQLPFDEPAFAITLISSFCAAIAAANLMATLVVLTGRFFPAAIAVAGLLVSHTFWQHATYTESYALVTALLTGEWLCLALFTRTGKARYLVLLAACNGLGIANHLLALLATPADVVVLAWAVRRQHLRLGTVLLAAAVWALGTLPYTMLVAATAISSGAWGATLHSALFGRYASAVFNMSVSTRGLSLALGYMCYNFPNMLPIWGLSSIRGPRVLPPVFCRAMFGQFAIFAVFVVRYAIVDQYTYFVVIYLFVAITSGIGMSKRLGERSVRRQRITAALTVCSVLLTPAFYVAAAQIMAQREMLVSFVGNKPYRDGYTAFFVPWGVAVDYGDVLNTEVGQLVRPGDLVVVTDDMIAHGLRYARTVGDLPKDISIVVASGHPSDEQKTRISNTIADCHAQGGRIVLVPRDRDHADLHGVGHWRRVGDAYVLERL